MKLWQISRAKSNAEIRFPLQKMQRAWGKARSTQKDLRMLRIAAIQNIHTTIRNSHCAHIHIIRHKGIKMRNFAVSYDMFAIMRSCIQKKGLFRT